MIKKFPGPYYGRDQETGELVEIPPEVLAEIDERHKERDERLLAFVREIAGQVCHYGTGLREDECLEKSGRRCQPCQARHLLRQS